MNTIQPVRYERHKRYVSVPILYFALLIVREGLKHTAVTALTAGLRGARTAQGEGGSIPSDRTRR